MYVAVFLTVGIFGLIVQTRHLDTLQAKNINRGGDIKKTPIFPVIHMDINSLKTLPSFDEPLSDIDKGHGIQANNQIPPNNRNVPQHKSTSIQNANAHSSIGTVNSLQNNMITTQPKSGMNHKHIPIHNKQQPFVQNTQSNRVAPQPMRTHVMSNTIFQPNVQQNAAMSRLPQRVNVNPVQKTVLNPEPAFHPPMKLTPSMSSMNRINRVISVNRQAMTNAQPGNMAMNPVQVNTIQGFQSSPFNRNRMSPVVMRQPAPLVMLPPQPLVVNGLQAQLPFIQTPIHNLQTLIPVQQDNLHSILSAIPKLQNPATINMLKTLIGGNAFKQVQKPVSNTNILNIKPQLPLKTPTAAPTTKPQSKKIKIKIQATTKEIRPQAIRKQSQNTINAPSTLTQNVPAAQVNVPRVSKDAPMVSQNAPTVSQNSATNTHINSKSIGLINQQSVLDALNKTFMTFLLEKLKQNVPINVVDSTASSITSSNFVRNEGVPTIKPQTVSVNVVRTQSRLSNSPLQLIGNPDATIINALTKSSGGPKRVSLSFKPTVSKPVVPTAPRVIEIVHTGPNSTTKNMTLEPFTATTIRKNGKMTITLTSKHTGNRPIVIEAAAGNIILSHVKGPDGKAQFLVKHAPASTTPPTGSSTPLTTTVAGEEVELEAEDIITTTPVMTSSSTIIPTTTSILVTKTG